MKPSQMKILLTGATGGIGEAIAVTFAASGAKLLLTSRSEDKLVALRERIQRKGGSVDIIPADLSSDSGLSRLRDAAKQFQGGINVLINNAGLNDFDFFAAQSAQRLAAIIEVNLTAPMLLTQALLPGLQDQSRSLIVNIGSISGSIGLPGQVAYCSSKFALHGFSEALRRELTGTSTRVVYVAPRATDTGMNGDAAQDINRKMGVATDSAGQVATRVFDAVVAGQRERFIGWPERLFVKLNALIPGLVDRSLAKQTRLMTQTPPREQQLAAANGVKQ